jgi:hypothetical protein
MISEAASRIGSRGHNRWATNKGGAGEPSEPAQRDAKKGGLANQNGWEGLVNQDIKNRMGTSAGERVGGPHPKGGRYSKIQNKKFKKGRRTKSVCATT